MSSCENIKDSKSKKKSTMPTKKCNQISSIKNVSSNSNCSSNINSNSNKINEPPIIKQIKKSVSRLDTTSDI